MIGFFDDNRSVWPAEKEPHTAAPSLARAIEVDVASIEEHGLDVPHGREGHLEVPTCAKITLGVRESRNRNSYTMCKVAMALAIASLVSPSLLESAETRSLTVQNLEEGIDVVVDGRVTEQAWTNIASYSGFTQQNPVEGAAASERTEVRLLLDQTTLYVGIILFDSDPSQILVTDSRRDEPLNETDSVQIILDTFNDNQNGFLFGTNPVGIEYDGQVAGEGQTGGTARQSGRGGARRGQVSGWNPNWDGNWAVRSAITERGWETEMAIPLKTLRYTPGDNQIWGFNVLRNIRRKNEQVFLAPIPRGYDIYRVSLAAKLEGLQLPGRRDVKVTPFALGSTGEDNLATSNQRQSDFEIGIDAKWGVTPNLTADFTVNTDFAQVETDEQQINLTRFPLFFPEKRPFFLENASTFSFGAPQEVDLFFSRRIGLESGIPIPILGGARMSGKVGAYNVGVLDMQTREAFNGRTGDLIAPAENFFVARVQREVGRSNFGGIFVNRQQTGATSSELAQNNRAYGVDANIQLTENTKLFTFLAGSTSAGETGTDYAGRALVTYATNWWSAHVGYTQVGERFDAQAGFVPRRGFRKPQARFFLNYQPKKYPWIRRLSPHVTWSTHYGFDNLVETSRGHFHFVEVRPQAGGRFGATLDRIQDRPDTPFPVYSDPSGDAVIIPPGFYTWNEWTLSYNGNPSAPFFFDVRYTWGGFYDGDLGRYSVTLNARVGAKIQASVGWRRDDVTLPGGEFKTDLVPVRFNYSFTPLMNIQALIQYNSQSADISSNIRFALLNRSGTGLFFVYNDQRNTANFTRIDPDTGIVVPNLIGRSFVVKYTYLFDF